MKRCDRSNRLLAVAVVIGLVSTATHSKEATETKKPATIEQAASGDTAIDKKKVSYGIGVDIGKNFKHLGLDVDLDRLTQGLKDAYSGNKLELTEDDLRTIMGAYRADLMRKQSATLKAAADANQQAGEVFLAANARKDGVVTLPSGLQYKIVKAGTGNKPGDEDTVRCNYRGVLLDGTVFDSSGQPALFRVSGVIPGWKEALKLMPVGSTWQLFVPPQLAYGMNGAGRDIGPNATLQFDVELLDILPPVSPVGSAAAAS
jgi:FKBP-type peptidyl-prolyl cis-trans isomerase